mmetsp:Transcript_98614/g.257037  ORF Transcript_98614/g.257037 Transcript_98614/m.257037 type:complete len:223 (+) Transcript_98614:486-1154(+)
MVRHTAGHRQRPRRPPGRGDLLQGLRGPAKGRRQQHRAAVHGRVGLPRSPEAPLLPRPPAGALLPAAARGQRRRGPPGDGGAGARHRDGAAVERTDPDPLPGTGRAPALPRAPQSLRGGRSLADGAERARAAGLPRPGREDNTQPRRPPRMLDDAGHHPCPPRGDHQPDDLHGGKRRGLLRRLSCGAHRWAGSLLGQLSTRTYHRRLAQARTRPDDRQLTGR